MDDLGPMMRRAVEALDVLAKGVTAKSYTPRQVVDLSEAVSTARAALYAELMSQGWVPPESVPPDLALDVRLRQEGVGSGYDDPVGGGD